MYCSGRKLSPTPPSNRLSIEAPNEKDEGISDEEDPAELRLLLELNEQVMKHKKNKKIPIKGIKNYVSLILTNVGSIN